MACFTAKCSRYEWLDSIITECCQVIPDRIPIPKSRLTKNTESVIDVPISIDGECEAGVWLRKNL